MTRLLSLLALFFYTHLVIAQTEVALYSGEIPNATKASDQEAMRNNHPDGTHNVSVPKLYVYKAAKPNGTSVIICPGGGYGGLVMEREGHHVARMFNEQGVTAFVLKYRLPSDRTMVRKEIGPLQDIQRAIQMVRENSNEWGIDANKIGVMGFSAGGHLAASSGVLFNRVEIPNPKQTSVRPDFMLLIYPVISFNEAYGHTGTKRNLIGENPSASLIKAFSNEENVTVQTPPTFLTHPTDDSVVPVENSLIFYEKLKANKVPVGMHIYAKGGHGYLKEPAFEEWFGRTLEWMRAMNFL